MNRQDST